ncbi:MAG: glycosyltransferase family 4 protein [Clostridia bacterium]|nr:glycosyltransferase family 4 protein [Clostridia bacterium]
MKILITSDCYLPMINGVVTSIQQLTDNLRAMGHEVKILSLSQKMRNYVEGDVTYLASMNMEVIYPDARFRFPKFNDEVKALIDWKPDLIHSQSEFASYLIAKRLAKRLGIPVVHTYHTVYEDYTHYFSPSKKLGKKIAATGTRWVCKKPKAVIAPTEKVRKMLERYGIGPDGKQVFVVPTGIDPAPFADRSQRDALREKYGISPDTCLLVAVGRLGKEKNYEEVLRYLKQFDDPRVRLLLVGDGPDRPRLQKIAEELELGDRIVFAGMIPHSEIGPYYSVADLFVCASSSETQGLTYLEAEAAGLPVLCRRDDCLSGVIINGENGWQYDTYEEFADYLKQMLDPDLREKMGVTAKSHMEAHYSAEAFAKKVLGIYESVLAKHAAKTQQNV